MSCESYDLRLTTLSPIHIGSGKSYSCCEFVPAKAKSKGQIVKIIKRVNLTNYYSSLSDDRKDTFLASLTNSNFELKQFDKKIKKDFVRYQCIDNSRVDFINEVQEHIKTSDKLYIPGSSIKGAIRTAIFYDLLTEDDMDKIGKDISSNRRNNSFLSNDLLKKHFTSGFGNDAQYNIFRFMQVADTTTTNLPRIEQVLAVMATDDRRKNQFYSRHGKVVKSYLETIGANKNLEQLSQILFKKWLTDFDLKNEFSISEPFKESNLGKIPESWEIKTIGDLSDVKGRIGWRGYTTNDLVDDGPWVVGGKEITSGFIDFNSAKHLTREKYEESPEIMLKDKDLIIAKTGTIGPIAMFYEIYGDATLNPNVGLIRSKMIAPALLLTFFKTPRAQYYLNEFTTSSVQPAINQTTIKQLEVAIPSDKQLLEKIGNKFEEINLLQFNLNEEIKKLQKLRDTLLPKLMSGEIDVSEVNCDLELKYNYMKYLFNQIHTPMSKSVV